MEDKVEYGMLDLNNKDQIIEYEEGLYKAFSQQGSRVSLKYKMSGERRLSPILPYENLEIYTIREDGRQLCDNLYV